MRAIELARRRDRAGPGYRWHVYSCSAGQNWLHAGRLARPEAVITGLVPVIHVFFSARQ
jgi:hypothetical protein